VRLGSLRQLTLVSFFVALIPLVVLLIQSQTDLTLVASKTAQDNAFIVTAVSRSRKLGNDAIAIERLIRQYSIVKDQGIASRTQDSLVAFHTDLDALCRLLQSKTTAQIDGATDNQAICQNVATRLARLTEFEGIDDQLLLDAQLSEFRQRVDKLQAVVSEAINKQISIQQTTIDKLRQVQAWSTVLLALISLVLIVFASQLIVKPFKKLTVMIRSMAEQTEELPAISRDGPRELVRVEKDLHWLNDRLLQLEHLRTALLRHAAHELKTPLALNEELVGELNDAQKEVVGLLISSTQRLNMLVEKLLDYNLLLQQAQPDFKTVNIHTIVEQCLKENALALNQNNHQVEVELKVESVRIDIELGRRILDNLISNAIAHGAKDDPIKLCIYHTDTSLVIECGNGGRKIAASEQQTLFQPFVRGNTARNDRVVGAGLGLSIVADCARLMHGIAQIVDVEYADVCFRVTIPK
jgi:two-component system sensor histidine kinase GlrK